MRLSRWRSNAPYRDALGPKVTAVLNPVLGAFGADTDPEAWVAWGDDPQVRYAIFSPVADGLLMCHVRPNVPGEGVRASAKLIRWPRVQVGEMSIETQGGHRVALFQLEGQVLRAADAQADEIAAFARSVFAGIDGRLGQSAGAVRTRKTTKPATAKSSGAAKPAPKASRALVPAADASDAAAASASAGKPARRATRRPAG